MNYPTEHSETGGSGQTSLQPAFPAPPEETGATSHALQQYQTLGSVIVLLLLAYGVSTAPDFQQISPWAAQNFVLDPGMVKEGEWWRLITGPLLHANMEHVARNLFGIFIFGRMVEGTYGSQLMLWLTAVVWLVSSVGMVLLMQQPAVGFSGVVYGYMAAYILSMLGLSFTHNRAQFGRELQGAIVFFLVFAGLEWFSPEPIAVWGHICGFVAGLMFMGVLQPWKTLIRSVTVTAPENETPPAPEQLSDRSRDRLPSTEKDSFL